MGSLEKRILDWLSGLECCDYDQKGASLNPKVNVMSPLGPWERTSSCSKDCLTLNFQEIYVNLGNFLDGPILGDHKESCNETY